MKTLLTALSIGLVIAVIDIIPMIIQRLPRYTTAAAFVHYWVASIIIVLIDIPFLPWWIEGGALGLLLMIPMLIHVAHTDRKPVPVIATFSFVLGAAAGVAGHFLL